MTYFTIENLAIPSVWIATLIALVVAAVLNRVTGGQKIGDWYWNGFFLYFILWKLSYIYLNFKMFLNMPFSIVYYNGGIKGHLFALASLLIYLLIIASKKHPTIYVEGTRVFLFYFINYKVVMNLLEQNIKEATIQSILLLGYISLLFYLHTRKRLFTSQMFVVIFLLELLIYSLFRTIISIEIFTFLLLGLTMMILLRKKGE